MLATESLSCCLPYLIQGVYRLQAKHICITTNLKISSKQLDT